MVLKFCFNHLMLWLFLIFFFLPFHDLSFSIFKGGLDCRCLITNLPTEKCVVRTLTTIATPHRSSSFMDWCQENIRVGEISQTFEEAAKVVNNA
ncbi:hypothetical protein C2G38_2098377 [Gigaspora rosea]|uniref:Uncharacterized protein n=1 Tax=Gigaspora rosea TaxID=44941 RepID=A0A397V0I6_9GLOM|nr:hypothetical protein C2G38_2098377 [Gigaspora rosea]